MTEQKSGGFNWKYLIPLYGVYLIHKSGGPQKAKWYFANIAITLVLFAILGGGENDATNAGNPSAPNTKVASESKKTDITAGRFCRDNYNNLS